MLVHNANGTAVNAGALGDVRRNDHNRAGPTEEDPKCRSEGRRCRTCCRRRSRACRPASSCPVCCRRAGRSNRRRGSGRPSTQTRWSQHERRRGGRRCRACVAMSSPKACKTECCRLEALQHPCYYSDMFPAGVELHSPACVAGRESRARRLDRECLACPCLDLCQSLLVGVCELECVAAWCQ